MWRGEDMTMCDVYIQTESGFDVLHLIGELECVQFIDMNCEVSAIDKHYVSDLCRCADLEQNLNYLREEIIKEGVPIPRLRDLSDVEALHPKAMFEFENMMDEWIRDVKDMNANHTNLKKIKTETKEFLCVLQYLDPIVGDVELGNTKLPKGMSQTEGRFDQRQLKIVTGIVERSTSYHFQTMLWRISHGNIYYREAWLDENFLNPISGREVRKVAFVVICHGDELHQRVLKVCNGFNINLYRWPDKHVDRVSMIDELCNRMQEIDKVLQRTKYQRAAAFHNIAVQWETWMTQVLKAKAIYYQLNLFNMDISSNTLIGQCWIADRLYDDIETALESSSELVGGRSFMVRTFTNNTPPTNYRTNRYTEPFQSVIDSYQVGRYKELNPGIFALITFPFLFGVMFGDVGHGVILFIYAVWMINNEKKYKYRSTTNELWNLIFKGRYMIMLMGMSAMYMGFLYNEWFSLTCKMMPAYWYNRYSIATLEKYINGTLPLFSRKSSIGYVYPYGIDPALKFSEDNLAVENTLKMKLAIILGVAHIAIGLFLNFLNYVHFKKYYAIFFHFLPKLVFVSCIYGYLCYLIFHKWFKPTIVEKWDLRPYLPPLRDQFFYFIFWSHRSKLHGHYMDLSKKEKKFNLSMFESRQTKVVLYHIALACFPVMLFGSPIYLYIKHRLHTSRIEREKDYKPYQMRGQDSEEFKKQPEFNLGEVLLQRLWRTMEFGLGTISHMASYLRLWAISLAHGLLSDFFWHEIMRSLALHDFTLNGIWKLYLVFFLWALITLFFLVLMDSLTVFIHVLRLHWIEFMSTFFKGDGIPFRPFALSTVLDERDFKREEETKALCRLRKARDSAGDYY